MTMTDRIRKLETVQLEKPEKVLTMYLNMDPSDPGHQGGEWKIQLKNAMSNFEEYVENSGNKEELKNFRKVRSRAEKFVDSHHQDHLKSIVLFASADDSVWFAETLQMRVETEFFWEMAPRLEQLEQLNREFPKSGIILVQQNHVKIVEAELGVVQDTREYMLDLDTEDWRKYKGQPTSGNPRRGGTQGSGVQQHKYEDSIRVNQKRWYKGLAPKLDKMAKKDEWQRIYLVGKKEEIAEIEDHMNKPIDDRVPKNLLNQKEEKVIEEVVA